MPRSRRCGGGQGAAVRGHGRRGSGRRAAAARGQRRLRQQRLSAFAGASHPPQPRGFQHINTTASGAALLPVRPSQLVELFARSLTGRGDGDFSHSDDDDDDDDSDDHGDDQESIEGGQIVDNEDSRRDKEEEHDEPTTTDHSNCELYIGNAQSISAYSRQDWAPQLGRYAVVDPNLIRAHIEPLCQPDGVRSQVSTPAPVQPRVHPSRLALLHSVDPRSVVDDPCEEHTRAEQGSTYGGDASEAAFDMSRRYDDGEVTRYGAGESYRPFNGTRSPRRAASPGPRRTSPPPRRSSPPPRRASPPRRPSPVARRISPPPPRRQSPGLRRASPSLRRASPVSRRGSPPPRRSSPLPRRGGASPPRRPRSPIRGDRGRTPPVGVDNDRYIPDRTPRRSPDRFRRDASWDRRDGRDSGPDNWRRRDRSRSIRRSPLPRRSPGPPMRRSSPPPRGGRMSPRRDDRRDDRRDVRDRFRSPRRGGFDTRFANSNNVPIPSKPGNLTRALSRRRSRSPDDRIRDRPRERSPPRRSPGPMARPNNFRGRTRSPDRRDERRGMDDRREDRRDERRDDRRDDRYMGNYARRPSPARELVSANSIPIHPSRDSSRKPSPLPPASRRDDRTHPDSPARSRPLSRSSPGISSKEKSPQRTLRDSSAPTPVARSPPRGPAAQRQPPTGPRDRGFSSQPPSAPSAARASGTPSAPRAAQSPATTSSRHDMPSPTIPPTGPRGHFAARGGPSFRGGRGPSTSGWGTNLQNRSVQQSASGPPSTSASVSPVHGAPSGPRGSISQQQNSGPPTPVLGSKPFDPPKGPAADKNSRMTLAQRLLAELPPIIPGGKLAPDLIPLTTGVLPELQAHMDALKEEEEKIRKEKYVKEERLRRSLQEWDKLGREIKLLELKCELSTASLRKIAGEETGGAAF